MRVLRTCCKHVFRNSSYFNSGLPFFSLCQLPLFICLMNLLVGKLDLTASNCRLIYWIINLHPRRDAAMSQYEVLSSIFFCGCESRAQNVHVRMAGFESRLQTWDSPTQAGLLTFWRELSVYCVCYSNVTKVISLYFIFVILNILIQFYNPIRVMRSSSFENCL
jgi:hypothetical protein